MTLNGVALDNVTLSGGTDVLDHTSPLLVNIDSTIQYATLQDGTLAVAPGQTLTLDNVALHNVTLSGGTDDLDGVFSGVSSDSTIENATLQDGMLAVASGQTLTLNDVILDNVSLSGAGQTLTLNGVALGNVTLSGGTDVLDHTSPLLVNTDSTIQYATLQDGTLAVAPGQTLTLDNVTLDNVTLSGGADDLDGVFSGVSSDSTIENATLQDGMLAVASGQTLTLNSVTLEASAAIVAGGVLTFATGNAIENAGSLLASGAGSELMVDTTTLTLFGHGTVALASGGAIVGNGTPSTPDTLENVDNTITGTGTIGDAGNGELALINDVSGTIAAFGATLTLDTGNAIVNSGLLEATGSGTLNITDSIKGAGNIEIGNAATVELGGIVTNMITFEGGTGLLQIDSFGTSSHYSLFGGGALLPAGDEIYLPNISFDAAADSYNTNTNVITVSNGTSAGTVTIDVAGGVGSGDTFVFESQGSGTLVYDPPSGTDILDPPVKSSSTSVSPNGDTFIFHPGMGADVASNFTAKTDTIDLDHFANIGSDRQLTSLIDSNAHGDAVIELGHHDSITLPGASANTLQAHLHSLVHLI